MKKDDLTTLTEAQLVKREKTLKFTVGILAGLLIVLLVVAAYISIRDRTFNPALITPVALSAIIPISMKKIKDIRAELARRRGES